MFTPCEESLGLGMDQLLPKWIFYPYLRALKLLIDFESEILEKPVALGNIATHFNHFDSPAPHLRGFWAQKVFNFSQIIYSHHF